MRQKGEGSPLLGIEGPDCLGPNRSKQVPWTVPRKLLGDHADSGALELGPPVDSPLLKAKLLSYHRHIQIQTWDSGPRQCQMFWFVQYWTSEFDKREWHPNNFGNSGELIKEWTILLMLVLNACSPTLKQTVSKHNYPNKERFMSHQPLTTLLFYYNVDKRHWFKNKVISFRTK